MTNEHAKRAGEPDSGEAVDAWGRPLADLSDHDLLEQATTYVTNAYTLTNGLLAFDLTKERRAELSTDLEQHSELRQRVPLLTREGWIDIVARYPAICSRLRSEFNSLRDQDR